MIHSQIHAVGTVRFPEHFRGVNLHMYPVDITASSWVNLPDEAAEFEAVVDRMLRCVDLRLGDTVYVTIEQSHCGPGKAQREPGPHVDGNPLYSDGARERGWLARKLARKLPADQHTAQYASALGGVLMASDVPACQAWEGQFVGAPGIGGDCSHLGEQLTTTSPMLLEANEVYLANSTCIHESLPLAVPVIRTWVRITLPTSFRYRAPVLAPEVSALRVASL